MKNQILRNTIGLALFGSLAAFSTGAMADHLDWSDAEADILGGNYGTSADWVIADGFPVFVAGEEYVAGEFGELVCRDYEVTVEKSRIANPQGRGKTRTIVDTETVTYCQDNPDYTP